MPKWIEELGLIDKSIGEAFIGSVPLKRPKHSIPNYKHPCVVLVQTVSITACEMYHFYLLSQINFQPCIMMKRSLYHGALCDDWTYSRHVPMGPNPLQPLSESRIDTGD